jgi:preprotein translocase subunit SecG
MKAYLIIRVLLALHIAGIIIMAGTTMIDYLTFKTFWHFAKQGDDRSVGLLPLMAKYGAFVRTGAVIIITTGIAMFLLEKGIRWGQLRFKVKMGLVLLIILNGVLVGNRQGHKLRETVAANASDFMQHTMKIRESMDRFYPIQLTLFFLIILISVIRSNKQVINV